MGHGTCKVRVESVTVRLRKEAGNSVYRKTPPPVATAHHYVNGFLGNASINP
jgi:hypothetical protein